MPKVSPDATKTRSPDAKKPKKRVPTWCPHFCGFVIFGLIFVPLAVFVISAIFALPLWGLECAEAREVPGYVELAWSDEDNLCSFYQWWIYIIGNLVGVGITNVGPAAGHVFAELIDLLIAVWSLTVAGLVIGLVGSLAWVNMLVEGADSSVTTRLQALAGFNQEANALAASASGLDFAEFSALCEEHNIRIAEARRRELFDSSDADGSGTIGTAEIDKLLAVMRKEEAEAPGGGDVDMGMVVARMDAMEAKLDKLLGLLDKGA